MKDLIEVIASGESIKVEHAVNKKGAIYLGASLLIALIIGFAIGAIILKNV